ncbi:MAG: hypothetical protein PUG10_10930 [Lachnospiraceae bacterium]|nr:hypothetical protein [Lachnospiraceae bacterium]
MYSIDELRNMILDQLNTEASIFPCVIAEMCEVDHMSDEDIVKKAIELHIIERYEEDE